MLDPCFAKPKAIPEYIEYFNKCNNDYILVLSAHCQITKLDFKKVKKQLDFGNLSVCSNATAHDMTSHIVN